MNATYVNRTTRFVTLAAALLVTGVEWAGFSEIFLRVDPARIASVPAADAAPGRVLPEVVVTARRGG